MLDFSLNVIIDQDWIQGRDLVKLTEALLAGGVTMVQYRNKHGTGRQFYENARLIHQVIRQSRVPLIINDRLDIALCVNAGGIHVGRHDIPIPAARKVLGKQKIIGFSVSHPDEIRAIEGADYLGVGALFPTETKTDAEYGGLSLIRQTRKQCRLPLIGIGGITKDNAAQVIQAGADGIAVISAVLESPDPAQAVRDLLKIVRDEKAGRGNFS